MIDSAFDDFLRLARTPSERDLSEAALLVTRVAYRALDPEPYLGEIDRLGREAAERLTRRTDERDIQARVAELSEFLFEELGFAGSRDHYEDPRNSFLNDVLIRRTGLPITLSLVYIEVGRRAGLPLEGVNFPGHFLVRCRAPLEASTACELRRDAVRP